MLMDASLASRSQLPAGAPFCPQRSVRFDQWRPGSTWAGSENAIRVDFEDADGHAVDRQTRSTWDVSGRAVSGPLRRRSLRLLVQNSQFWFVLSAFAPHVRLLGAGP